MEAAEAASGAMEEEAEAVELELHRTQASIGMQEANRYGLYIALAHSASTV